MKKYLASFFLACLALSVSAQDYNQLDENGNFTTQSQKKKTADSLGTDKEIPVGIKVWTVDRRFGDQKPAEPDTLSHNFMNTIFNSGMRGEYNSLGNVGSPRINRIFIDRDNEGQFIFTAPYSFFLTPVEDFHFTNTLSPITNITYNNCGNRTDGEDHFTAKFGVNAGKKLGVGFKFDYIYGRGYYANQSTSHFNYTMYGSYLGDRYQAHLLLSTNHEKVAENGGITDDNYITHPESYNESYASTEIPTMLEQNWNRNDNHHVYFTQRYNVGFNRKVPMTKEEIEARKFAIQAKKDAEKRKEQARREREEEDDISFRRAGEEPRTQKENKYSGRPDDAKIAAGPIQSDSLSKKGRIAVKSKAAADSLLAAQKNAEEDTSWLKNEYVPVTSFIHTADFNVYRRIYQAYQTPDNYYLDEYDVDEKFSGDSIFDKTSHWSLRNTVAISMLEGFNKWAKAGLKIFATHEMRHFTLPDSAGVDKWNEQTLSVGGQISKVQGKTLHYNAIGEFGVVGENSGEIHVDGSIDLNFPLFRDTMSLVASGFFHHEKPIFYFRHYQSKHLWWDNDDLSMIDHFRVQGLLNYQKTRTRIRVAFDEIKNYAYFATTYTTSDEQRIYNTVTVNQTSDPITMLTAEVAQDFTFGPLNWESVVTFQKSTKEDIIPVPTINVYSNLYFRFKIAHVLKCDIGADVRYFTKYHAPEYVPSLGQFAVQANESKVDVGGYPIINVYANFHLKRTRFFVMFSHVNEGNGSKEYFLVPHNPLNPRVFRLGLSWNFLN